MIVVVGRPGLGRARTGRATIEGSDTDELSGMAAAIASAVARAGSPVELVGSIGDDPEGDRVAVLLGRAGIGHAALIRDPAGSTPLAGVDRTPAPRLDGADVELGLHYLPEIRVIVLASPLPDDALSEALAAASYHGAGVIAVVAKGGTATSELAAASTVLEAPDGAIAPFAEMVGRFAAALDGGLEPARAFSEATSSAGWEPSAG